MKHSNELIEECILLKEVHYGFENIIQKIIGRIFRVIKGDSQKYKFLTSHVIRSECKQEIYFPSNSCANTLDEIEKNLATYIKLFELGDDFTPNPFF